MPAMTLTLGIFWVAMAVLLVLSVYPFLSETPRFTLAGWQKFVTDEFYWHVVRTTLTLALLVTGLTLIVGYPVAQAITRIRRPGILVMIYVVLVSPILVSVVVRTYGWLLLLSKQGLLNFALLRLGIVRDPVSLIFNMTGILIAMVHILLPFMVFPILSVMTQLDPDLKQAAGDLGASRWVTFRRVTLPLTLPGIISGCQIVFTLTISAFVTPFFMGGGRVQVLSGLIFRDVEGVNLSFASVVVFITLGLIVSILILTNRLTRQIYERADVSRT